MAAGSKDVESVVARCLEEANHYDPDNRIMAFSDLSSEVLQQDVELSPTLQREIRDTILKRLEVDTSVNVHSNAVKCLGDLIKRCSNDTVKAVCRALASHVTDKDKSDLRDVYAIGLRSVISNVPSAQGSLVAMELAGRLSEAARADVGERGDSGAAEGGLSTVMSSSIALESLEILEQLLGRFGAACGPHLSVVVESCMELVSVDAGPVGKRAASCLGVVACVLGDEELGAMVSSLADAIEEREDTRTQLHALSNVGRSVGGRLGGHLGRLIPLLKKAMNAEEDEDGGLFGRVVSLDEANAHLNDVREGCLHALAAFVSQCPEETTPFLDDIVRLAVGFAAFDPNYVYGTESSSSGDGGGGDEYGGGDDDDDEFGYDDDEDDYYEEEGLMERDEDDSSWKIRRASLRLLVAACATHRERCHTFFPWLAPRLTVLFREREPSVRADVFEALAELVKSLLRTATEAERKSSTSAPLSAAVSASSSSSSTTTTTSTSLLDVAASAGLVSVHARRALAQEVEGWADVVPSALKELLARMGEGKPSVAALSTLEALLSASFAIHSLAAPASAALFADAVHAITGACSDADPNMRLVGLTTLRAALRVAPAAAAAIAHDGGSSSVTKAVHEAAETAASACQDSWYRVVAAGLQACSFVPLSEADTSAVQVAFDAAIVPGEAPDVDNEVKHAATCALGVILGCAAEKLSGKDEEVTKGVAALVARLSSDLSRGVALRALRFALRNESVAHTAPTISEAATPLLRQKNRHIRQAALEVIEAAASVAPAPGLSAELITNAIQEASKSVNTQDAFLAGAALRTTGTLLRCAEGTAAFDKVKEAVAANLIEPAIALVGSPMVQGSVQAHLSTFLATAAAASLPKVDAAYIRDAAIAAAIESIGSGGGGVSGGGGGGGGGEGAAASSAAAGGGGGEASSMPGMLRRSASRTAQSHFGKAVARTAALVVSAVAEAADVVDDTMTVLASSLQGEARDPASMSAGSLVALESIAELGARHAALEGSGADVLIKVVTAVVDADGEMDEEVRAAAATALGGLAAGSLDKGLPLLLSRLDAVAPFTALAALRGCIARTPSEDAARLASDEVLELLQRLSTNSDDGVRTVCAECLGTLTAAAPDTTVPLLLRTISNTDAEGVEQRAAGILAARFAVAAKKGLVKDLGAPVVEALAADELPVRLAALHTLQRLVFTEPSQMRRLLQSDPESDDTPTPSAAASAASSSSSSSSPAPSATKPSDGAGAMAFVLYEMEPKPEYERVVDLGPFKHRVDDALPLRKAAITCLDTVLDRAEDVVDGHAMLRRLVVNLKDLPSAAVLAHQLLGKLAARQAWHRRIAAAAHPIAKALQHNLNLLSKKGGPTAEETDAVRSAIRTLQVLITSIPSLADDTNIATLLSAVKANPSAAAILASIRESTAAMLT